jgi:hypothetical protein
MGMFDKIIEDLENNDVDTLELLKDVSRSVEDTNKQSFDSSYLDGTDFTVCEKLIHGYNVLYQYRKKIILIKSKDGKNTQRELGELRIISIVQPLDHKIIVNADIRKLIKDKLQNDLGIR